MHFGQGKDSLVLTKRVCFQGSGEFLEESGRLAAPCGTLEDAQAHGDNRRTTQCPFVLAPSRSRSTQPSCSPRHARVTASSSAAARCRQPAWLPITAATASNAR